MQKEGMRPLLMGPPLTDRAYDSTIDCMDAHLHGVLGLLPQVYGDNEAARQAHMEFARVLDMPRDKDGVWCRRAALLYAIAHEEELASHLARKERAVQGDHHNHTYTEDLKERVLPFVLPRFIRNSCQRPDAFSMLCTILAEMWPEPLGNWPRRRAQ